MSEPLETTEGLVPKFTEPVAHLSTQIAEGGEIHNNSADGSVSVKKGFSRLYSTPPWETATIDGTARAGRYLDRGEMNKWAYLLTAMGPFLNRGGWFTFSQKVSSALKDDGKGIAAGYPKGAVLWWRNPTTGEMLRVVSMKDDNTDDFTAESYTIGITGDQSSASWKICSYNKDVLDGMFEGTIGAKERAAPGAVQKINAPKMGAANPAASNVTRYTAPEAVWAHLSFKDFAGLAMVRGKTRRQILSRRDCQEATFCLPLAAGDAVESPTPFSVRAVTQYIPQPLPYDAEVEYLESTGTLWINTGVVPGSDWSIAVTCSMVMNPTQSSTVWTARAITEPRRTISLFLIYNNQEKPLRFDYGYNQNSTPVAFSDYEHRHEYKNVGGKFYIDGTLYATIADEAYDCGGPLRIFAADDVNDPGNITLIASGKIYGVRVKNSSGVIVRDLIPVRVGSGANAVGCLYDQLGTGGQNPDGTARNDGLYFRQGSGEFVIGPDVTA